MKSWTKYFIKEKEKLSLVLVFQVILKLNKYLINWKVIILFLKDSCNQTFEDQARDLLNEFNGFCEVYNDIISADPGFAPHIISITGLMNRIIEMFTQNIDWVEDYKKWLYMWYP
jgi:hypothetical protein